MPSSEKSSIREDVKKLIAQIARMEAKDIREDANIRDELGVDSLSAMEILAAIEKRLGIQIDEARAFDVVTVDDLLELVMFYIKNKKR